MHLNSNRIVGVALVLLLQCTLCYSSFAQVSTLTRPLLGSLNQVQQDSVTNIIDNTGTLSLIEQTHVIKNMVSVGIEEESKYFIQTDFIATVVLHIIKYDQNQLVTEEFDSTFVVDYKKAEGAKYNSTQYFPFENAYRVDVKIISIAPNNGVTWNISRVLRVDNTLTAVRDYVFTCSTVIDGLAATLDDNNNELLASWNDPHCGQTEYDLEWAWVDESAIADYKVGTNFLQDKIFDNNATRVTIDSISYRIPLLYDGAGRLFVRVRPAQIKYNGQRIEGVWAWKNPNTATEPVYFVYGGHGNALNWQASTSFAEDGKRKSVIQYFDGTLRNRQTVTKDNTTNTTVVAETFYDYQGRPVIQVLPAPTLSTIIQYSKNFNKAINFDGYPKWAYDKLDNNTSTCGNPAMPLSTASGTAKYYSPENEKVNDPATGYNVNKYIPNSEGPVTGEAYPFTETRFTPDGRVAAQGGVGYTHQLGSSHETKYLYEPPAQEELDALFGTDAGVVSHYFKNLVKDANGQYSVSYTDMHGRTVATALAGGAPNQLDPLASVNTKNFTKQLIDDETNRVVGKSIISTKALVVPKEGLYKFRYELNPEQVTLLNCNGSAICYDCLYNLKIMITSDCNNLPDFISPFILVDSNFTIGQSLTAPACKPIGDTTGFFKDTFNLHLPEGAYTITKILSLSDSAQSIYREVFIKNDTCKTFQDFYDKEYQVLLTKSNCAITCTSCMAAIGNTFDDFRLKFVQESGMTDPLSADIVTQLQAAYNDALANCTRICNNENGVDDGMEAIRSIRQTMLLDVTPPYGQYAKLVDITTPFNILNNANDKNYSLSVGNPSPYKDEYGISENSDIASLTPEQFSGQFKTSWAEELLQYHPEYPKLQTTLEKLPAAYQFEADLIKTKTWQDAATAEFINNIIAQDPFFDGTVVNVDPREYIDIMVGKMNTYRTITSTSTDPLCTNSTINPSMWQLAQSVVFCRNIPLNPPCSTEQFQCLHDLPANPPLYPTTGCATDWDLVWQNFRTLYLTERKKLISKYVTQHSTPNNDAAITDVTYPPNTDPAAKLKLRFVDFNTISYVNLDVPSNVQSFFTDLSNGNPSVKETAHTLASEQYDSTCRGYTDMWLAQLAQCPAIAERWNVPTVKSADSIWLTERLIKICTDGSDEFHYLGSSSVNPSKPNVGYINTEGSPAIFKEFPEVINQFFINIGISTDELCHPYLITSPKPFDKQSSVTNELVITKPTDCECTRITNLRSEYQQYGIGFSTFSAYLKNRYGTDITQGALDDLTNLCGTSPCVFLSTPIVLPPLLQCHGTNGETVKPCIDCKDFQVIRSSFYSLFNKQAPIKEPQVQNDFDINNAFEKFANYKTGFSKNINEYISFLDSCGNFSAGDCGELQDILKNYIQNVKRGGVIHTLETHEHEHFTNLSQIIDTGTIHFPDSVRLRPDSTNYNNYGFQLAHNDRFCTDSGYSAEIRFKFSGINNTGDVFYSALGLDFTVDRNHGHNGLWTVINGVTYILDDNPDAILNWMTFKVKVLPNMNYLYYNNRLIVDYARDPAVQIGNIFSFGMGLYGRKSVIDWVKLWDAQDDLKFFEDFNNADNPAFVDPSFITPCPALDCITSFTNYFNQQKGTNYSYAQIDALYLSTCGVHPTPCNQTGSCTPLDLLISNYQNQYIKPAAGFVDYDLRTFAGNKTPDAGPKGVFDINKNIIGNTIDGTPLQIKQSYAQVWNSSTVNQATGTLSVLASGKFRLTLNAGQLAPCDGIIGMRFYQFDAPVDTLDAALVGPGCYIDFGDGNKESIVKGLDARGTKTFYYIQNTTASGYTADLSDSFYLTLYAIHTYTDSSLKTVTVYHPDIQGVFGFDNWYIISPLDLSKLKNLRGYMPQNTLGFIFHSIQDSSVNTTDNIVNFNQVNSIKYTGFADGSSTGGNSFTLLKNTNFSSFANNHNLSVIVSVPHNPKPSNQNNIQSFNTWFPDFKNNFNQLKSLRLTSYYGEYNAAAEDFSIPSLRAFMMQGYLNSTQIDSIVIQVSRSLQDSGVIQLYDYDGNPSVRTSASDAAYNSLASRNWSLKGGGMNLNNTVPASIILPLRDSFPLTNNFTEFYNQQYNTNYSYNQLMALLKSQCGYTPDYCTLFTKTCTDSVTQGPVLCGLNEPMFAPVAYNDDPCKDLAKFAYTAAEEKWQLYIDSLHNVFDTAYYNKCIAAKDLESFTVNYDESEYYYTLYYYDQAGNLVKTVPPAGVDDKHGDATFLPLVKAARFRVKNGESEDITDNKVVPVHTLVTEYRYNTLNQVVAQKTPDAGQSKFWYDLLGRLVVSQNAKQANPSQSGGKKYSYTLYDKLGRITEVGQKPQSADPNSRVPAELDTWLAGGGFNKTQVTRTRYDLSYNEGSNILTDPPSILVQRNLRNRVSYTMVYDAEPNPADILGTHSAATYYTYDIHGNVDTLLQDLRVAMLASSGNRYKKLVYNYDLISGKVNKVSYQPGLQDEFYHQYIYDAENRITDVYTSHNNLIWEKDARYSYYRHGPLARTILGQQQVQGVDYAYTLQGWLKGVNSTGVQKGNSIIGNGEDCGGNSAVENLVVNERLQPLPSKYVARTSITFTPGFDNNTPDDYIAYLDNTLTACGSDGTAGTTYTAPIGNLFDLGKDGIPAQDGIANQVANDVYGFNLNYFSGDYKPINSAVNPFGTIATPLPGGSATGESLFNGNISSMAVNIPKLGEAHLYGYRYDQLNRIVAMDAFTGLDGATNQWTLAATQNYKERISYDPNGNILTYMRNGNSARLPMDDMVYSYKAGSNKLDKVADAAPDAAASEYDKYNDIKRGQANGNYQYDEIGNLTSDVSEGITNITWNVYGKIQSITKASGTIGYTYDAGGNRISKTAGGKTTIYVRDASGNVMSVYTADPAVSSGNLLQSEVHLYGSSRLGIFDINRNVQILGSANYLNHINTNTRGEKILELSNHLQNVLVTISDKKIGVDVNSDGLIDYYNADVVTANDYYPGGMLMPGRRYSASSSKYRFGFNGKENDNEVKGEGNSLDFGARVYDPRLGRWMSVDALANKYPAVSPFAFALNTPIMAKDPDGNVVIFINGQHAGSGGTAAYWGGYDKDVKNALGDQSARYVDGALGGWKNTGSNAVAGAVVGSYGGWIGSVGTAVFSVLKSSNINRKVRIAAGQAQGKKDAADIIANLKEGETIKIVTHSMGTAFARGYVNGIMEYAKKNGLADKVKFEYELDVNTFQGADLPAKNGIPTQNKTGGLDGGKSFVEAVKGNSVPTVGKVPGATDTTDPSDADKGHAINEMSTSKIPLLGNGGDPGTVEQGNDNKKKP
jgi:RHS repeat-associated protein